MKLATSLLLVSSAVIAVAPAAVAQSAPPNASQAAPAPEIIFLHGSILTGAHLDPSRHPDPSSTPARVSALAVAGGRILAIGSDAAMLGMKGPRTQVLDLHGAFAMPGFNDAHTHMAFAGQQHLTVDLDNVPSLAEMQARITAYVHAPAQSARPGSWVRGGGWDHTKWASKTLPNRSDIDAVTGSHPAVFERTDGHILVANSLALAAAGIDANTPDPPGGKIDRDSSGNPTGIVREDPAMELIFKHIPPPGPETRRRALDLSIADALSHGVTSVQDFSDWEDWLVLESMEHEGALKLRFSEWIAFTLPVGALETRRASHDPNDPLLHLAMLKAFMDGSLGSRTAALAAPYSDDPDNSGIPRYTQDQLNQMSEDRAAAGFQLGFHAIGDEANHMALNAFAAAEQAGAPANTPPPPSDPDAALAGGSRSAPVVPAAFRFRIEHAQVLLPGDFERFHDLGVIASMQPSHLLTDMNWAAARLGPERARYSYAWRSMLDHGVTLAFGTDYPVESINPFRGLYAAITRQNEAGTAVYQPQERITLRDALYAYTQASAFAEFREHLKGRLEPGFLCDLVVLDRDILAPGTTPQQILHTRVLRTVVNGKTVYQAP